MKLVISFLLRVHLCRSSHETLHGYDSIAHDGVCFLDADVERWIRSGLKHVMLRLLGYGHVADDLPSLHATSMIITKASPQQRESDTSAYSPSPSDTGMARCDSDRGLVRC